MKLYGMDENDVEMINGYLELMELPITAILEWARFAKNRLLMPSEDDKRHVALLQELVAELVKKQHDAQAK
jgi:hypothetical protein